jgi:hypothetical protein
VRLVEGYTVLETNGHDVNRAKYNTVRSSAVQSVAVEHSAGGKNERQ